MRRRIQSLSMAAEYPLGWEWGVLARMTTLPRLVDAPHVLGQCRWSPMLVQLPQGLTRLLRSLLIPSRVGIQGIAWFKKVK